MEKKITRICFCLVVGMACCLILGTPLTLAADEPAADDNWRKTYDEVMLWLNFAILAFVLVKFAGPPLMNFLRGRKDELARQIDQVEKEKEKVTGKISEAFKTLEESETRFASMKQRIIDQGERRKQEIIEDARRQSQIMLEASKQKVSSQILQAKGTFKAELVDAAIEMATEKLPQHITEEDNQRFVDSYLSGAMK